MEELVIDANVIVEYLKSEGGLLPQIWDHYKLHTPVTSVTELMASKKSADEETKKKIEEILKKYFKLIPIDDAVARKAAEIMQELDIALADALLAASAIVKDLPLVTYDLSTFDLIPDLKLVDI
jgi:predicted nucleic acid-binding protein